MDRRRFGAMLAVIGATGYAAGKEPDKEPELLRLGPSGWMPNNARLPVLLYRRAFPESGEMAARAMEVAFTRHGWPPQWRNGVYDFHHFHSTAHEVLGFAAGEAQLVLGGEEGQPITVRAGDVAVLPVGTGHCRLRASPDFLVIGAYAPGAHWDICRSAPDAAMLERMKKVLFPESDPVHGAGGPLPRLWAIPKI